MFPSISISDTFIYNPNPNSNPNPNPNSIQEQEIPPLFSHFPSPFLDDHTDFLSPQQHHHIFNSNDNIIYPKTLATQSQPSSSPPPPPQKKMRKTRKDRHSKIYTAQGVRARRMRLPLQIARRFFDLQDMLGLDKASKTIDWLLAKSKGAIKELTKNLPSTNGKGGCGYFSDSFKGEKNKRDLGKARESRDKARARARERTREKMMMRSVEKMTQLGSSSSHPNSSFDSSSSHQSLNNQFANVGIDGNLSNSIFDYEKIIGGVLGGLDYSSSNNFLEFLENWDVENEMNGY